MRRTFTILCVLAATAAGAARAEAPPTVATVAREPITRAQLDEQLSAARHASRGRAFPARGTPAYRSLQDTAVRFLVDWTEVRQQAYPLGVSVSAADVDARIADIKRTFFRGSERLWRQALRRQGLTEAQARRNVSAQLLAARIYDAVARNAPDLPPDAAWTLWLADLHARYASLVTYAAGYEPRPPVH